MKKLTRNIFVIFLIISIILLPCCKHSTPIVTQDAIVQLYNNNSSMFDGVVEMVFKDGFYDELAEYYIFYENDKLSIQYNNEVVKYQLPDEIYSALLNCFRLLDDIVDDSYKPKEYIIVATFDQDYRGISFCIDDLTIEYTHFLTYADNPEACLENTPSSTYKINDNWFYWGWGQV